ASTATEIRRNGWNARALLYGTPDRLCRSNLLRAPGFCRAIPIPEGRQRLSLPPSPVAIVRSPGRGRISEHGLLAGKPFDSGSCSRQRSAVDSISWSLLFE